MRNISKSNYKIYRQDYKDGNHFEDLIEGKKSEIRQNLVQDQGHLCCYCMMRIQGTPDDTNVEHNKPASKYPDLIFEYSNLLAACKRTAGKEPEKKRSFDPVDQKKKEKHQTCDTAKKDIEISKNPAIHNVEALIQYDIHGRISSSDPVFHRDLVDVLNLNKVELVNARKAVVIALGKSIDSRFPGKSANENQLKNMLKPYTEPNSNGQLPAFSGVAVYYLVKKIRQHNPGYQRGSEK